jgi:hypothetical protein
MLFASRREHILYNRLALVNPPLTAVTVPVAQYLAEMSRAARLRATGIEMRVAAVSIYRKLRRENCATHGAEDMK